MTSEQARALVARTVGRSSADAAGALLAPLEADTSGIVVLPSSDSQDLDAEDLLTDEVVEDSEALPSSTSPTKTICKEIDYYDALLNYTIMGVKVCTSWKYNREVVGNGSRTISPFVTTFGTATLWRWSGANIAQSAYYNYKRHGAKTGYHTRTVGHFQHCPSQIVVTVCDQDRLPQIVIDGHYDGTYSSALTP